MWSTLRRPRSSIRPELDLFEVCVPEPVVDLFESDVFAREGVMQSGPNP